MLDYLNPIELLSETEENNHLARAKISIAIYSGRWKKLVKERSWLMAAMFAEAISGSMNLGIFVSALVVQKMRTYHQKYYPACSTFCASDTLDAGTQIGNQDATP